MRIALAVALALVALLPGAARGVLSDTTPPQLTALAVDAGPYDITTGQQTITGTATVTDDLSGVNTGCVPGFPCGSPTQLSVRSPSGAQHASAIFAPAGGDAYTFAVTIPQYAETGAWTVDSVLLVDGVGNSTWLNRSDLQAAGFGIAANVTGTSDTTPPTLIGFAIDTGPYDISTTQQLVTGTMQIDDDLSGVSTGCTPGIPCGSPTQISLQSPSGNQHASAIVTPAGGNSYAFAARVLRYAEAGAWHVSSILLVDNVGNSSSLAESDLIAAGFATTVDVVGTSDMASPVLTADAIAPAAVDVTGGSATTTITATITDSLSGVNTGCIPGGVCGGGLTQLLLRSPSGQQHAVGIARSLGGDDYAFDVRIPQFAEAGVWRIDYFLLGDNAGNTAWLFAAQLTAGGLELELAVSKIDSGTTASGGTFSTAGPNATDPVQVAITTPVGGVVSVQVTPVTQPLPAGWNVVGQQLNIDAPAGTVAAPLTLVFRLDPSQMPVGGIGSVDVFRNGSLVGSCTGAGATPDPCVGSRTTLPGGVGELAIRSSHASRWNLGIRLNSLPACGGVAASPATVWPPNGKLVPVSLRGATDADGDALTYTVTGVTVNEAYAGGDVVVRNGSASVAAKRNGAGSGRVYTLAVSVSDGHGSCTAAATVAVPHDQR